MVNAKNYRTKKSPRKPLGARATDRAKQDVAFACKEEEAIAQMVKDFRRQARKKTRLIPRVLSLSTVRASFGNVLDRVRLNNERVIITYRGRPEVIIISIGEFNKANNLDIR